MLRPEWKDEVFKYMAGIIKGKGQKPIIVNGMSDHVHVFFGLKPAMSMNNFTPSGLLSFDNCFFYNNYIPLGFFRKFA